ncbi:Splicing factor [Xylographa opegraphella]|nr:Splicing factor [Xylographa opegraphella]
MDISALLSPQDAPVRDAPTQAVAKASPRRPRKPRATTKSFTASKIGASPLSRAYVPAEPSLPDGALTARLPMPSPPTDGSPLQQASGTTSTPSVDGSRLHRQSSTSGMDTLADLASMQHHQQTARANAGGLRNTEVYDNPLSTAANLPNFHALTRKPSSSRSPFDITMPDAHSQTPSPRSYSAASLSQSESETIAQLFAYLAENPYAYESHVQLVSLLHRGLVNHVHPPNDSATPYGDPHTYTLLPDLQTATEAMDARFALGEELWAERMQAQKWLAVTLEDCLGVMETGQKAVREETGSTKLWLLYGDWMLSLYNTAHRSNQYFAPPDAATDKSSTWSEEDKLVAAEVFGKKQILDIWHQAAEDTKHRINDSHLIWDRYMDLLLQDLSQSQSRSREAVVSIKQQFIARLQIPHAAWDQTFQTFSTFVSTYDNDLYEATMVAVNRQSASAKQKYEAREIFEVNLRRAIDNADKSAEWSATVEYLDWERSQSRRNKVSSFEPANSLYQRAILRFSTDTSLWEDYSMFLVDENEHQHHSIAMLPLLERACRHCPWSGTLWSMYLQEAECEQRPFTDIGEIKHKATSTGLLDAGGMEEVLKVLTAWCGFLRRRAFQPDSTDEEIDVAEVGIRSAIEDMETLGRQKYGNDYKGDPQYRLERIYIKYLSQSHNWQAARDTWKSLINRHGDSYEFWLRYYNWEMLTWSKHSPIDNRVPDEVPHEATKVLRQAIRRQHLDWPEKVMDTFLHHCEDHESVVELQLAVNQTRKAMKSVTKRREAEAVETAELTKQQQQQQAKISAEYATHNVTVNGKRKRENAETDENSAKKSRAEVIESRELTVEDEPTSAQSALKRDRENSTVIVKNLPFDTTEKRVRHYFRDCGTINSLQIIPDDGGSSSTATIEFDSKEDVLTAQTKDMKLFEGKEIEVQVGTGSTLYVTNFPPIADEIYIRDLFGKYGDIISVRFPSLKYDKRRRFCYVQFKSSSQAQAATELDGISQDGNLKLYVKISDPGHKKARTGPMYEGREVHVMNVDWSVTEEELSEVFSKYGNVEKVRIPRNMAGKSKGFAFVVFSNQDEAAAALDLNLTKFKTRLLHVSMSTSDPAKRQAINNVRQISTSTSPAPDPATGSLPSKSTSDTSPALSTSDSTTPIAQAATAPSTVTSHPSRSDIAARTLALLHVPDTVNETRVRALLEPYGSLKKLTMRHDHQGAIVEFADVSSVGKVALGLEGVEIAEGRRITVGSVAELMQEKGEVRRDRLPIGQLKKEGDAKMIQSSGVIRRPVQTTGRRGGRGGLGLKKSGGGLGGPRAAGDGAATTNGDAGPATDGDTVMGASAEAGQVKTNADFKAMFLKR